MFVYTAFAFLCQEEKKGSVIPQPFRHRQKAAGWNRITGPVSGCGHQP
jgi:hypothetical protein